MQLGLVVGFYFGWPSGEVLALEAGHHLGEGAQVPGEGIQVRAPGPDRGELGLLAGVTTR